MMMPVIKSVWENELHFFFLQKSITFSQIIVVTSSFLVTTVLDIKSVEFLQFQRGFLPQAKLEELLYIIIHKPIDFSYRFKI